MGSGPSWVPNLCFRQAPDVPAKAEGWTVGRSVAARTRRVTLGSWLTVLAIAVIMLAVTTPAAASKVTPSRARVLATPTPTVVRLHSSANPATTVTYAATVSPIPDGGTVKFTSGSVVISGCSARLVRTVTGKATCKVTYTAVGTFKIRAVYAGSANFATSKSKALHEQIDQDATTTAVTSDANPSVYGQLMTFTVTVSADNSTAGTPTGTVTFTVNGDDDCAHGTATVTLSNGQATCPIEIDLGPGSYEVVVTYSGDPNFLASSNAASPLTQVVSQDATTTTLTSSSTESRAGDAVTYTAVSTADSPSGATPMGTVTFTATNQATRALTDLSCDGSGSDSVAIAFNPTADQYEADCQASINAAGTYTITGSYVDSVDGNFLPSSGDLTETVLPPG